MGILTLLTDFGTRDVYVGVMKGVIAKINPSVTLIDLTHDIPPHDITAARFHLLNAVPYFPKEAVHVAVVDPGVGGNRRAIALHTSIGYLVGPDNGIWSGIFEAEGPIAATILTAVELNKPAYWRVPQPSTTFHGRDIFSPIGAHLTRGISLTEVGTEIDPSTLVTLALPVYQQVDKIIHGCIQSIDHFGNLITNIPAQAILSTVARLDESSTWQIHIADTTIPSVQTYANQPAGTLIALIGSHGFVEIAVNCGSAQAQLKAIAGTSVYLSISEI